MKILLLGERGQLGWELKRTLACLGELIATDYPQIDFLQPESLRSLVRTERPDVIVNAVAYTNVDKAEKEIDAVRLVNVEAVGVLAEEAVRCEAALIHYSTDYVFDGKKGEAYTEEDVPNPIGVYAKSKLDGEQVIQQLGGGYCVFRTSWLYSLRQTNFVLKVWQWARQQEVLKIVSDQMGSPTSARFLAELTALCLAKAGEDWRNTFLQRRGIYHAGGRGGTSRYEWAKAILELDPHPEEWKFRHLLPVSSAEFAGIATRPGNVVLDCGRLERVWGLSLPDWKDALRWTLAV